MSGALKIMPAALALRDFRAPGPDAAATHRPDPPPSPAPARPRPDMKKLLRAAYRVGRRKEARAAQERLQHALKTLDETHARRLEEERARWREDIAERLATQLREALAALEDRLRAALAQVLTPMLEEVARETAVAALADMLRAHLAEGRGVTIEVGGPPALLEALRRHLEPEHAAMLRLSEALGQAELSARIDETALTTCVAEWARKHLPERSQ